MRQERRRRSGGGGHPQAVHLEPIERKHRSPGMSASLMQRPAGWKCAAAALETGHRAQCSPPARCRGLIVIPARAAAHQTPAGWTRRPLRAGHKGRRPGAAHSRCLHCC